MIERFAEEQLRGFLHRPEQPSGDGIALTHGAGSNCQAPLLIAVCEEFAAAGFTVLRFDLAFRQARTGGPPRPADAALDREGIRAAAAALRRIATGRLFLGGHSYGGRQACMLAAEDSGVAEGLLLLSYPLHPPGKAAQMRTAHFPQLSTPAVFVHGSRDPFGTLEEMRSALALIPAPTSLVEIEGAGHDLKRAGSPQSIVKHFRAFMFPRYNSVYQP
jgi:predicted alpha/beta-hydrolase family hydrolase